MQRRYTHVARSGRRAVLVRECPDPRIPRCSTRDRSMETATQQSTTLTVSPLVAATGTDCVRGARAQPLIGGPTTTAPNSFIVASMFGAGASGTGLVDASCRAGWPARMKNASNPPGVWMSSRRDRGESALNVWDRSLPASVQFGSYHRPSSSTWRYPSSCARARATVVLPEPGGPTTTTRSTDKSWVEPAMHGPIPDAVVRVTMWGWVPLPRSGSCRSC